MRAPVALSRSGMMALYEGIVQMMDEYAVGTHSDQECLYMQIEDALDDFRAATLQPLLDEYQGLLEELDNRFAASVMQFNKKEVNAQEAAGVVA